MEWDKRRFSVSMAAFQHIMLYQEVENCIFRYNSILRHTHICINNLYWQGSGIIFLCNCCRVSQIHWWALGCVFLVARCNIIRASWETKKEWLSYRKKVMWQSTSCVSRVASYELKVQKRELKFKSASSNPRVQIHELRVQIYELRVQIHQLQVYLYDLRVTVSAEHISFE